MGATAENVSASLEQVCSRASLQTWQAMTLDSMSSRQSSTCGKTNCVLLRLDLNIGFAAPSLIFAAPYKRRSNDGELCTLSRDLSDGEVILGDNFTFLFAFYFH
jgi:hypothetical protein